jgi:hypothetical protein
MSVQSFRERAQFQLDELIAAQQRQFENIHIEAVELQTGVVPKPTAEQIGMQTITLTNRIWALKKARDILDEVFKELAAPPKPQEGEDGGHDTEESDRGGYG